MQPAGHTQFYTTLTDATGRHPQYCILPVGLTASPDGPVRMQFVDDERMFRTAAGMSLEKVRMIDWQIVVSVRHHLHIFLGPDFERDHGADQRQHS